MAELPTDLIPAVVLQVHVVLQFVDRLVEPLQHLLHLSAIMLPLLTVHRTDFPPENTMAHSDYVIDVGTENFTDQVIEASHDRPVVVDFWAPWCGPCRTLGPNLEQLAEDGGGDWILAKVNIDHNQPLAGRFGVRGIPAVKAFVDGEVVDEFTGALPKSQIQRWLQMFLPSEADERAKQGRQAEQKGELHDAERAYRQALDDDPNHATALMGMARINAERDDLDGVDQWMERVPPGDDGADSADFQQLWLKIRAADVDDVDHLQARIDDDTADLEARFELAVATAADERYEEALQQLLPIVEIDGHWRDELGRTTMLRIFKLLDDDEAVRQWQKRLGRAMY